MASAYGLVFLGAGLGGVLRFLISEWATKAVSWPVPAGTLIVNAVGCFVAGYLLAFSTRNAGFSPEVKHLVVMGILGGFTTFSAFGKETIELVSKGEIGAALLNIVLQNGIGLGFAWVGFSAAQKVLPVSA